MHEQSETIQRADGKWINVYGRGVTGKAGQPLPRQFPWEREAYDTVQEAEAAARLRSRATPSTDELSTIFTAPGVGAR